jgi:hypothetical protein
MFPLGAAVLLLIGYHLLMLGVSFLLRLFSRHTQQANDVTASDVFKVKV